MPHPPRVVRTRDSLAVPRSAAENPPEHAKVLRSKDREYRDKKARHERRHRYECAGVPPGLLSQSEITPEREDNETARRERRGRCDENVRAIHVACTQQHRGALEAVADER